MVARAIPGSRSAAVDRLGGVTAKSTKPPCPALMRVVSFTPRQYRFPTTARRRPCNRVNRPGLPTRGQFAGVACRQRRSRRSGTSGATKGAAVRQRRSVRGGAVNAFVGAMVGLERSTLPLVGRESFGVTSATAASKARTPKRPLVPTGSPSRQRKRSGRSASIAARRTEHPRRRTPACAGCSTTTWPTNTQTTADQRCAHGYWTRSRMTRSAEDPSSTRTTESDSAAASLNQSPPTTPGTQRTPALLPNSHPVTAELSPGDGRTLTW